MMWFFEKGTERIRIETRYDQPSAQYVLVHDVNGTHQIEHFQSSDEFRARLEHLEQQLQKEQWTQIGPMFLRDGWKLT
jgi:hypothetical protein